MKFGRLEDVEGVDFTLPPDAARNAGVLGGRRATAPRALVGTSGWSDAGHVGRLYPSGTRRAGFLAAYARAFPAVELNSTYYGVDPERIAVWARSVPQRFRFCPKLPSSVSHDRRLRDCDAEMESFAAALAGFGDRLGRAWTVAPPGFDRAHLPDLTSFVEAWAPRLPLAVELRHPDWFSDPALNDAWGELFEAHGVVAILTDVAGRRDVLHMRLTAPETFVRFVGNALHPSDFQRLDDWAERLGAWIDRGLETAYLFLHMADEPQTVDLAAHLLPRLGRRAGLELEVSTPGAADGQLELF